MARSFCVFYCDDPYHTIKGDHFCVFYVVILTASKGDLHRYMYMYHCLCGCWGISRDPYIFMCIGNQCKKSHIDYSVYNIIY